MPTAPISREPRSCWSQSRSSFPRSSCSGAIAWTRGTLIGWLKEHLGWIIVIVRRLKAPERGLLVPEGTEVEWEKLFPSGFRPLPRRWVVERSFAWITRWRRLARDHEGRPESSEAFIKLSACRRMLSLLAPPFP